MNILQIHDSLSPETSESRSKEVKTLNLLSQVKGKLGQGIISEIQKMKLKNVVFHNKLLSRPDFSKLIDSAEALG